MLQSDAMKRNPIALFLAALITLPLVACESETSEPPYLILAPSPTATEEASTPTLTATPPVALSVGTAVIPPTPTFAPPLPSAYTRSIPKGAYAVLGAGTVDDAAISPDSQYLAVANAGVVVYKLDTFERVWSVPVRAAGLAWSPNGRLLAAARGDSVIVWNGHTGERLTILKHPVGDLTAFRWSPLGDRLATASNFVVLKQMAPETLAARHEGALVVWDVDSGNPLFVIHNLGAVQDVEWSPRGQSIATTRYDAGTPANTAKYILDLWGVPLGQHLNSTEITHAGDIAWSPDAARIALDNSVGEGIPILDATSLQSVITLQTNTFLADTLVAWSPDGQQIAGYNRDQIWIWDAITGKTMHMLTIPGGMLPVTQGNLTWSADSRLALLSRPDNNAMVVEAASGEVLFNFEDHHQGAVALSPDGRYIVSSTGALTVWDTQNMQPLHQIQGTAPIGALAFSHDGATLFSGSRFGITQWDVASALPVRTLFLPQEDSYRKEWQVRNVELSPDNVRLILGLWRVSPLEFSDSASVIMGLATGNYTTAIDPLGAERTSSWSPDGRYITWYDENDRLTVSDESRQSRVAQIATTTGANAWSADGKWLAYGDASKPGVRLLQIDTGQTSAIGESDLTAAVTDVAFSPNGRLVAAISNNALYCWNIQTGKRLFSIRDQPIYNMAWSPDGKLLAMGAYRADGGKILLWDVVNARLLPPIEGHTDRVSALAFSPEGNFLASGSADGTIILWAMQPGANPTPGSGTSP